jgi:phosphatidylglycerophosphatase A
MREPPKQNNPTKEIVLDQPSSPTVSPLIKIFASALYSGYAPVASGTVGSLVGLILYFIPGFESNYVLLPACVVVFLLGGFAAGRMEMFYGHDPSTVTIDEVLGMWVSLLFLPKSLLLAGGAFIIFRLLDVVKPWPARFFDRKHGGWNIMLDDIVAGIYANLVLQLAVRIL